MKALMLPKLVAKNLGPIKSHCDILIRTSLKNIKYFLFTSLEKNKSL